MVHREENHRSNSARNGKILMANHGLKTRPPVGTWMPITLNLWLMEELTVDQTFNPCHAAIILEGIKKTETSPAGAGEEDHEG